MNGAAERIAETGLPYSCIDIRWLNMIQGGIMRRTTLLIAAVATTLLLAPAFVSAQDLPESSPQALMHHAQGVDAYVKGANQDAIKHFVLAYETDPTSYVSLLMAGVAAGNAGQGARADSFYAKLAPNKDKLSAYYRYRLEAALAGRAGDVAGAMAANRKAAELGSGTKAWYNVAQAGAPRGMASEAREALRKLDPDKEPMKGWFSYYGVYTASAHALGDHEDELTMARRARAAFPGDIRSLELEGIALAALGRGTDADKLVAEIQTMSPRGGTTAGDALTTIGQELMAHGNPAAGRRALEAALKWSDALPADSAKTSASRLTRAYALYTLGRQRDAAPIFASLATDEPTNNGWKAWVGYMAALNGDRAKAMETAQKIESGEINLGRVNGPLWRALIAAGLNDRDRALVLFRESGLRALWMHRDPVVVKAMGPVWTEFLKQAS
jgi:Flp pilus assembly protein TadD